MSRLPPAYRRQRRTAPAHLRSSARHSSGGTCDIAQVLGQFESSRSHGRPRMPTATDRHIATAPGTSSSPRGRFLRDSRVHPRITHEGEPVDVIVQARPAELPSRPSITSASPARFLHSSARPAGVPLGLEPAVAERMRQLPQSLRTEAEEKAIRQGEERRVAGHLEAITAELAFRGVVALQRPTEAPSCLASHLSAPSLGEGRMSSIEPASAGAEASAGKHRVTIVDGIRLAVLALVRRARTRSRARRSYKLLVGPPSRQPRERRARMPAAE